MAKSKNNKIKNILTFEVEDRFHVDSPDIEAEGVKSRIIPILIHLLDHLDEMKTIGTFFVLGWVGVKFPEVVSLIENRGHEIGSHGYSHCDYRDASRDKIKAELNRSKGVLESIIKKTIKGFKLAGDHLQKDHFPIYEDIADAGYLYDCSMLSGSFDQCDNKPINLKVASDKNVKLIPQTLYKKFGVNFKIGEKIRLYPWWFINSAITEINQQGFPVMVNLKLWELDHYQKRPVNSDITQFTDYSNRNVTEDKLLRLLEAFEFTSCADAIGLDHD